MFQVTLKIVIKMSEQNLCANLHGYVNHAHDCQLSLTMTHLYPSNPVQCVLFDMMVLIKGWANSSRGVDYLYLPQTLKTVKTVVFQLIFT